jgi:RimJ/RimL family protein N-acetyltransferase
VDLISLNKEHFSDLRLLAKDKRIWEYYVYDGSDPAKFDEILESALVEREKGFQFPFVILHKGDNRIIGSTRFLDIQFKHRKLEIGTTWVHPQYWGTEVNLECKLLLLTFCFEILQALRVQLKTDENNTRSRKAIEKIGGEFEGILRNDMLRDNITRRNSACYSIIAQEWDEKKIRLTSLLRNKCKARI